MTSRLKMFCTADVQAAMRRHDVYADCQSLLPTDFAAWPPFCQAQYLETTTLLPGYILSSQGDRMAMAHGVEGRYPFLDHRVVEFAARVPPRLKMRGLCEKYLLKRATRHLVPEAVAKRTKQPYRAPDAESFFGLAGAASSSMPEYIETLLSPRRIEEDGLFHAETVARLVQKARRGDVIGFKDNMALVGILSTQLVVEQFVRNYQPPSEQSVARMEPRYPVGAVSSPDGDFATTVTTTSNPLSPYEATASPIPLHCDRTPPRQEHSPMNDLSTLREFIRDNFLYGKEPTFSDDDSFLEMGLIDSTGVLELVAHLEGRHGFTIEDDELVPENLDSIHNIEQFIERKTRIGSKA